MDLSVLCSYLSLEKYSGKPNTTSPSSSSACCAIVQLAFYWIAFWSTLDIWCINIGMLCRNCSLISHFSNYLYYTICQVPPFLFLLTTYRETLNLGKWFIFSFSYSGIWAFSYNGEAFKHNSLVSFSNSTVFIYSFVSFTNSIGLDSI